MKHLFQIRQVSLTTVLFLLFLHASTLSFAATQHKQSLPTVVLKQEYVDIQNQEKDKQENAMCYGVDNACFNSCKSVKGRANGCNDFCKKPEPCGKANGLKAQQTAHFALIKEVRSFIENRIEPDLDYKLSDNFQDCSVFALNNLSSAEALSSNKKHSIQINDAEDFTFTTKEAIKDYVLKVQSDEDLSELDQCLLLKI